MGNRIGAPTGFSKPAARNQKTSEDLTIRIMETWKRTGNGLGTKKRFCNVTMVLVGIGSKI